MNIQNYIAEKKEMYEQLLLFIDNDTLNEVHFSELMQIINTQNIQNNTMEFKNLIQLIITISQNHQRSPSFYTKIERILTEFKDKIKQTYSNNELFQVVNNG